MAADYFAANAGESQGSSIYRAERKPATNMKLSCCTFRDESLFHQLTLTTQGHLKALKACLLLLLLWPPLLSAATVPAGFGDTSLGGYWPEVTGLTFDET